MKKTAVFIDYENVRIRSLELDSPVDVYKNDFVEKLIHKLKAYKLLISNVFVYDDFNDSFFKGRNPVSKFLGMGVTPKQVLQVNGLKNSADIELCLDAYELCLKNGVETFVVVSSDKDMFPLIKKLKSNFKEVILVGVTFNASSYIIKYVDDFIPLESVLGVAFDPDFLIKQDIISATRRLKDLCDWTAKKGSSGLKKEFYIDSLKDELFETDDYIEQLYDKLIANNIAEEYTYSYNSINYIGVKYKSNQDFTDIINGKKPKFH